MLCCVVADHPLPPRIIQFVRFVTVVAVGRENVKALALRPACNELRHGTFFPLSGTERSLPPRAVYCSTSCKIGYPFSCDFVSVGKQEQVPAFRLNMNLHEKDSHKSGYQMNLDCREYLRFHDYPCCYSYI